MTAEGAGEQGVEHILLSARALQVARQGGERSQATTQIVEHEKQNAGSDGESEQNVEIIPPGSPGTAGAKEWVVQVMESPQTEGHS